MDIKAGGFKKAVGLWITSLGAELEAWGLAVEGAADVEPVKRCGSCSAVVQWVARNAEGDTELTPVKFNDTPLCPVCGQIWRAA